MYTQSYIHILKSCMALANTPDGLLEVTKYTVVGCNDIVLCSVIYT